MDVLEDYYGKETFALYSLLAKVPGKKSWPRVIFLTFSVLVLSCSTVFQLLMMITEKFKREVVIQLLPTTAATGGTLMYIPYVIFTTTEDYGTLLTIMLNDLRVEVSEEENNIRRWYAKQARMFTKASTMIFGLATCGIPLSGFIRCFLNVLVPLNETRKKQLFVSVEPLIDEDKYFYYLYLLECCIAIVVCIVVGVSENMSVIIGHHGCSMVAVLGFANRIADFYDIPLTLILVGTFSALTLSLVQATDPEMTNSTVIFLAITQILQLFILSYLGQSGMDASERIAVNAYNSDWHICPPNARKYLQLIILRSSSPYMVVARGIYKLTLHNFMSVMQTVTSFYMVLRQTS